MDSFFFHLACCHDTTLILLRLQVCLYLLCFVVPDYCSMSVPTTGLHFRSCRSLGRIFAGVQYCTYCIYRYLHNIPYKQCIYFYVFYVSRKVYKFLRTSTMYTFGVRSSCSTDTNPKSGRACFLQLCIQAQSS